MPAVTIDPSIEACQALIARINTGTAYTLQVDAIYSEQLIDPLEEIDVLRVDVCTDESETLEETLAIEDRTSHKIRIWIRNKVNDWENRTIDPLKLLVRQIYQRINNFDSSNQRVRVWECDYEPLENPSKETLRTAGLFVSQIVLRVEVDPPA
ncbi:hypothetical protein LBMAG52_36690 [Planctomycetia bacterium]|nr:hypothetical protein LBMAG52_36690 [Planctomycetia bacterium]